MGLTPTLAGDLGAQELAALLPDRAIRTYPAALSSEVDALGWARSDAPHGAVVVAEYQAAPRGRGGLEWHPSPGRGLIFSMVLRFKQLAVKDGWLWLAAGTAVADVLGDETRTHWPDELWAGGARAASVNVQVDAPTIVQWAVVSVFVEDARPPRAPLLAALAQAIEQRTASSATPVAAAYGRRCRTLGRTVRARLVPMGPAGEEIVGEALSVRPDGSLVIEAGTETLERRAIIPPSSLGLLSEE